MKYLTNALKEKLHGSLGLSYVIEGEDGHNTFKKEDGTFETQNTNTKLVVADICPQNDLITVDFGAEHDRSITMSGEELRVFAKELLSWADIVEETL
jgi:hypothetical protein